MNQQLLNALQKSNREIVRVLAVRAIQTGLIHQQFAHGRSFPVKAERVRRFEVVERAEPKAFAKFRAYRPSFSTTEGFRDAELMKLGFSKVNGEPVAYYRLRAYDRNCGRVVSELYLYAIRRGKPTQIQQLSVR